MKRTMIVCGYGPGISDAVARRFGREGFAVALVARNAARLAAAEQELGGAGITAKGFACDLASTDAVRALVREVRESLGPVAIVHWNAYGHGAGDLTADSSVAELRGALDVALHGMLAATQEALPDLRAHQGALLVTGGGLALYDAKIDAMAVEWGAMGLSVAKAAQHKAVGLLHQRLARDNVYVGEVVVLGSVKGTAFDTGHATLEASTIAERFWTLYQGRSEASVNVM